MENFGNKKKAGRKPGKDNKMPLTIYIEQSVIKNIGNGILDDGKDKAREAASQCIYELSGTTKRTQVTNTTI